MGLFGLGKKKKEADEDFMDLTDLGDKGSAFGPARKAIPPADMPGLPDMGSMGMGGGNSQMMQKDIEVLNSKIDALKSEIEALNHRVRFMEEKLKLKTEEESRERYGTTAAAPIQETGWHY